MKKAGRRVLTPVTVRDTRGVLKRPLKAAVCSDLHNAPFGDVLPALRGVDCILIPGDLVNRHEERQDNALRFLSEAASIAPVYYSFGNHERKMPHAEDWPGLVRGLPVTMLSGGPVRLRDDLSLGGLDSAAPGMPTDEAARALAAMPGFRLLLCHHPEHYEPLVAPCPIDLTLAGHAHGGQIQVFGRGLFAPGQGILPRLTHGFYFGGRLLVSRGMTNSAKPPLPRVNNPCEVILLTLLPGP